MSTKHDRTACADPNKVPTAEELVREWDRMDLDLALWLIHRAKKIRRAQKVACIGTDCMEGLHASTWRALILVWSTSPGARLRYSADSRRGLSLAATSMDDATLLALVRGLLDEVGPSQEPQQMAA